LTPLSTTCATRAGNWPRKQVLGVEFAGTMEAVGRAVTRFKPGDRVFGIDVFGCHAEYERVPEDECVALMPEGRAFEDAAGVPFGGVPGPRLRLAPEADRRPQCPGCTASFRYMQVSIMNT
jgi:NADPH:quinone reductase-like Zn-dependent oxidoreductase